MKSILPEAAETCEDEGPNLSIQVTVDGGMSKAIN